MRRKCIHRIFFRQYLHIELEFSIMWEIQSNLKSFVDVYMYLILSIKFYQNLVTFYDLKEYSYDIIEFPNHVRLLKKRTKITTLYFEEVKYYFKVINLLFVLLILRTKLLLVLFLFCKRMFKKAALSLHHNIQHSLYAQIVL